MGTPAPAALSLRARVAALVAGQVACLVVVAWAAGYAAWRITGGAGVPPPLLLALGVPVLGLLPKFARDPLRVVDGLHQLVVAVRSPASADEPGRALPFDDAEGDLGLLARAIRDLQEAATIREILFRRAPVGICLMDVAGRFRRVNPAAEALLGYTDEELRGRDVLDLVHPDHRASTMAIRQVVRSEPNYRSTYENRFIRHDGSTLWCAVGIGLLHSPSGQLESYILILRDISEAKRQTELAARVQRSLLPRERPRLPGYDLDSAFVPAGVVAGDYYDWSLAGDGHLDLTIADVMGKGLGPALVMASLRTALRAAPDDHGPAARVSRVNETMTSGSGVEGLFVTMFHGRLDCASGELRYVDAGHGYCVIRRADGAIVRLRQDSLPLGLADVAPMDGAAYVESVVALEPGDLLLLYSDGLVEVGDTTADEEVLLQALDGSQTAREVVDVLTRRVPAPTDDVTMVVLRRLPAAPP